MAIIELTGELRGRSLADYEEGQRVSITIEPDSMPDGWWDKVSAMFEGGDPRVYIRIGEKE